MCTQGRPPSHFPGLTQRYRVFPAKQRLCRLCPHLERRQRHQSTLLSFPDDYLADCGRQWRSSRSVLRMQRRISNFLSCPRYQLAQSETIVALSGSCLSPQQIILPMCRRHKTTSPGGVPGSIAVALRIALPAAERCIASRRQLAADAQAGQFALHVRVIEQAAAVRPGKLRQGLEAAIDLHAEPGAGADAAAIQRDMYSSSIITSSWPMKGAGCLSR